MNILAIGAHPDDVEFLCAGTLLKYRQQEHKIFIALTTSGNIGSNVAASREEIAAIREAEQIESARFYDAEIRFLRFDDEGLINTPASRRAVLNAMRWADPDVILTNPPWDPSTDHGTTGKLVTDVLLSLPGKLVPADEPPVAKAPSVFFWDIPGGIGFSPEAYVDISDVMDRKIEALSKHKSQIEWMGNFSFGAPFYEYSRLMARFRGMQAGVQYAEGFIGHRIFGFMPNFKLLP